MFGRYGGFSGPFATIDRKPRQTRKGAAAAVDSGAGVWLLRLPPLFWIRPLYAGGSPVC